MTQHIDFCSFVVCLGLETGFQKDLKIERYKTDNRLTRGSYLRYIQILAEAERILDLLMPPRTQGKLLCSPDRKVFPRVPGSLVRN